LAVSEDRTTIIVSHRVGSARLAERIIVLEEGMVVEDGSHEELMQRRGVDHELYQMQAQWYH